MFEGIYRNRKIKKRGNSYGTFVPVAIFKHLKWEEDNKLEFSVVKMDGKEVLVIKKQDSK